MKLTLKVEWKTTGPLAHARTLRSLEDAARAAKNLAELFQAAWKIPGLCAYPGGSHVAIHAKDMYGHFGWGSQRLAIITEEEDTTPLVEVRVSVAGPAPPMPEAFPVRLLVLDDYGAKTVDVSTEEQWHAALFLHWRCRPAGPSGIHPADQRQSGECVYPTDTP